ncbi:TonB-dependent receptor [Vibrio sinensis]|uniref:TonB-dependent receptor n=1 Tax=Vibrio sinensis TaxID=2302434 RepID=UPI0026D7EBDC
MSNIKSSSLLLLASCCSAPAAYADSISLPIWKEKAEALGYELPKPIGFNLSYMSMEQGINVDSIALNDLQTGSKLLNKLLASNFLGFDIEAEPGRQKTEVVTLRADVWLFPFLNVYGLVGKIKGYSETDINAYVTIGGKRVNANKPIPGSFKLDLDGYTTGGGIVLAGGYENVFALVDASYTQSTLTVIDGSIDAIVISPRVGYDFNHTGVPLRVWAGAMYQDVEQELSGSISDIIPGIGGTFEVTQHLSTTWNPIMGAQYKINDDWYLLGEAGFGDRESVFVSIDRRF